MRILLRLSNRVTAVGGPVSSDAGAGLDQVIFGKRRVRRYQAAQLAADGLGAAGPELTTEKLMQAIEAMSVYKDPFGYRMTFGPDDHKGVDESVLLTVVNGRWEVQAEKISY